MRLLSGSRSGRRARAAITQWAARDGILVRANKWRIRARGAEVVAERCRHGDRGRIVNADCYRLHALLGQCSHMHPPCLRRLVDRV
jgi:hypothetical protein